MTFAGALSDHLEPKHDIVWEIYVEYTWNMRGTFSMGYTVQKLGFFIGMI